MAYNVISYIAMISQTGTDAPIVVNELANGYNKTFTWTRVGTGTYTINSPDVGTFKTGSTIVIIGPTGGFTYAGNTNDQVCYVNTYNTAGASGDGQLIETLVEIRSFINS